MTLFGWDASHYDGQLSRAILDRAYAEGIRFFTHEIGEGLTDTEGTMDDTALAAARDAGIPFVGGYLIPRTNATPADQVARWVQVADAGEPWWRTFGGWFWQIDLERWSYDNVPASVGIECAQRMQDATSRVALLYASRGQYGDQLTPWPGALWNADYRGGPGYPGDDWVAADKGAPAGWAPYSGKTPAILQYTSSATIAGLSTCDANAFRGSLDDFRQMIGAHMAGEYSPDTARAIAVGALGAGYVQYLEPGWDDDLKTYNLKAVEERLTAAIAGLHLEVALTDTDRQAIADLILAGMPKPPTAAEIADELAARLKA